MISRLVLFIAAAAAFVGCAGPAGSSAPLKTADCFNQGLTLDAGGSQVATYSVVDCGTAHDGEVFSVFDYPAAPSQFPGYEAIGAAQQTSCQRDFAIYVGVDWADSSYTIDYIAPTEQTWAQGERSIKCIAEDSTGAGKLTGSVRGSKK